MAGRVLMAMAPRVRVLLLRVRSGLGRMGRGGWGWRMWCGLLVTVLWVLGREVRRRSCLEQSRWGIILLLETVAADEAISAFGYVSHTDALDESVNSGLSQAGANDVERNYPVRQARIRTRIRTPTSLEIHDKGPRILVLDRLLILRHARLVGAVEHIPTSS